MVPAASCRAYRWAACACGTRIAAEAPALRVTRPKDRGSVRRGLINPTQESNAGHSEAFMTGIGLGRFDTEEELRG
jgi:hypothetical protein